MTLSVNHKNLLFVSNTNALQKHITKCNGIYPQKQNEENRNMRPINCYLWSRYPKKLIITIWSREKKNQVQSLPTSMKFTLYLQSITSKTAGRNNQTYSLSFQIKLHLPCQSLFFINLK